VIAKIGFLFYYQQGIILGHSFLHFKTPFSSLTAKIQVQFDITAYDLN